MDIDWIEKSNDLRKWTLARRKVKSSKVIMPNSISDLSVGIERLRIAIEKLRVLLVLIDCTDLQPTANSLLRPEDLEYFLKTDR